MSTRVTWGPAEHGQALSLDEFLAGDYEEGHRYELIEGRLYVTPAPNYSHEWIVEFIRELLLRYRRKRPDIVNLVSSGARVFVPGAAGITAPEPDLALYRGVPPGPNVDWRQISPLLVIEILGGDDEDKDLVRNVKLYHQVPSIGEYWVIDICEDPARPTMTVHRRRPRSWQKIEVAFGETYRTDLLPGFELLLDPSRG